MKKSKYTPAEDDDDMPKNIVNEAAAVYYTNNNSSSENFIAKAYVNPVRRALDLMNLGAEASAKKITNKTDFITFIREGVPKASLDKLIEVTGFSPTEMAHILHTTDRTLRRYTAKQKLNAEQSERLIELAKLYARGEEVFNNLEQFKLWMSTPVYALGNKQPQTYLDTSMGIELLMDELGRIEYGIFA